MNYHYSPSTNSVFNSNNLRRTSTQNGNSVRATSLGLVISHDKKRSGPGSTLTSSYPACGTAWRALKLLSSSSSSSLLGCIYMLEACRGRRLERNIIAAKHDICSDLYDRPPPAAAAAKRTRDKTVGEIAQGRSLRRIRWSPPVDAVYVIAVAVSL